MDAGYWRSIRMKVSTDFNTIEEYKAYLKGYSDAMDWAEKTFGI
jgi:hypothetical protein